MFNTYIYHKLPLTCFGVCYTIFRETIALFAQKLLSLCNVAIKCTIYHIFKIYNQHCKFKTNKLYFTFYSTTNV